MDDQNILDSLENLYDQLVLVAEKVEATNTLLESLLDETRGINPRLDTISDNTAEYP